METVPKDIKQEILLNLSDKDLNHLCAVDKTFYSICKDDSFWKKRGLHYFPKDFTEFMKKYNLKEKETYQLLSQLSHLRKVFPGPFAKKNLIDIYETEKLNLSKNELRTIPKEIGSLSNLQYLILNHNQIRYLPREIGSLRNLKTLYLDYNQLQDLPEEIGSLRSLKMLGLSSNQLSSLPKGILYLPDLHHIYLEDNFLGYDAKELAKDLIKKGIKVHIDIDWYD